MDAPLYLFGDSGSSAVPMHGLQIVIWTYLGISLGLMLAIRATRGYPLYLLKMAWTSFSLLAFLWVVLMSGATTKEFRERPASVFEHLGAYPEHFRACYGFAAWWLPALVWPLLWTGAGWAAPGSKRRAAGRAALAVLSVGLAVPVLMIVSAFDWAPYSHFVENYAYAWRVARMGDYFLNSVLVSLCSVGLVTVLGSMSAYALTRLVFPGRQALTTLFIASMAIPGFLLVAPLFVMMKGWSLGNFSFMDSRVGLAVLYAAGSLPFTTFLLCAFYRSLPGELAESAALDGASPWTIFTRVYFPLAAPGMATAAIFNFLGVWNEYNFALIFLTNPAFKTLPVGLYNLQVASQYAVNWPAMFAGIVLLCAPTLLIFLVLQERIVAGLTVGAVKG